VTRLCYANAFGTLAGLDGGKTETLQTDSCADNDALGFAWAAIARAVSGLSIVALVSRRFLMYSGPEKFPHEFCR
jgi:hypothetical protein